MTEMRGAFFLSSDIHCSIQLPMNKMSLRAFSAKQPPFHWEIASPLSRLALTTRRRG